jgi:hypothetical protein
MYLFTSHHLPVAQADHVLLLLLIFDATTGCLATDSPIIAHPLRTCSQSTLKVPLD